MNPLLSPVIIRHCQHSRTVTWFADVEKITFGSLIARGNDWIRPERNLVQQQQSVGREVSATTASPQGWGGIASH